METKDIAFYSGDGIDHIISDYGVKNGFVDYGTLSDCFDCLLCENVTKLFQTLNFERISGRPVKEPGCFHWYLTDAYGVGVLQEWLNDEIIYHCKELELYLWCIPFHPSIFLQDILTPIKIVETENTISFHSPQRGELQCREKD